MQEERAWIKAQFAELNSLLEAEVDARCAVMQRLDQQAVDQRKSCEESLAKLQNSVDKAAEPTEGNPASLQALEQKLESTNLQVEMFRDNVNAVAAEARKHIKWVETEHEKSTARQDILEKGLLEIKLSMSSNKDSLETALQELSYRLSSSLSGQDLFDNALQDLRLQSSAAN